MLGQQSELGAWWSGGDIGLRTICLCNTFDFRRHSRVSTLGIGAWVTLGLSPQALGVRVVFWPYSLSFLGLISIRSSLFTIQCVAYILVVMSNYVFIARNRLIIFYCTIGLSLHELKSTAFSKQTLISLSWICDTGIIISFPLNVTSSFQNI